MELVAERIRESMTRARVSGRDLARMIGRTPVEVSHWRTARRPCPPEVLDLIAEALRVSRSWLCDSPSEVNGGTTGREARQRQIPSALENREMKSAWSWRSAPDDGGRDQGNSNIFANFPDLSALVRETGQNTSDAARSDGEAGGRIHMRFRLIELSRGSQQLREFLDEIGYPELRSHIERAARQRSRLATKLKEGLERFESDDRVLLLRIDDYGTIGLYGNEPRIDVEEGDEEADRSPYTALVRNNLDSSKQNAMAGGSYGLGKAVLWNCSSLSTVLFASRISDNADIRVTGKTELTWHIKDREPFAGPGWFGKKEQRAPSLWLSQQGNRRLAAMQLDRDTLPPEVDQAGATGTSALIVGFRDPESEDRAPTSEILSKIAEAMAANFFPLMIQGKLDVTVEHFVDGEQASSERVDPNKFVPEFCDALRKHLNEEVVPALQSPGDVVRREVPLHVPAMKPNATSKDLMPFDGPLDAQCVVLVRLAEPEADIGGLRRAVQVNRIALVRGRGMVTQFVSVSNMPIGAKSFHAILLAGEGCGSETPQLAAEQFLRLAEPPSHDKWELTDALRGTYRHGSKKAITDRPRELEDQVREAVRPTSTNKDDGPEELKRLLQLTTPPSPEAPLGTLKSIEGVLTADGAWQVSADVVVNDKKKHVRVTPRIFIDVESGSGIPLPWDRLEYTIGKKTAPVSEGGSFEIPPKSSSVSWRGISALEADGVSAAQCRTKIDCVIDEIAIVGENS